MPPAVWNRLDQQCVAFCTELKLRRTFNLASSSFAVTVAMADKEATVYIIDVGRSMGRKHQDRDETDLDWAMRYVWDKITTTVGGSISEQKFV